MGFKQKVIVYGKKMSSNFSNKKAVKNFVPIFQKPLLQCWQKSERDRINNNCVWYDNCQYFYMEP